MVMRKHDAQNRPESNRLIQCLINGMTGESVHVGKFVPFENSTGSRFFVRLPDGSFAEDRFAWNYTEQWDYVAERS
jgi:hypothetical protein